MVEWRVLCNCTAVPEKHSLATTGTRAGREQKSSDNTLAVGFVLVLTFLISKLTILLGDFAS